MTIRRMRTEDARQVAAIEQEVFSCPWSRQGFLDSLANPAAVFLVAEEAAKEEAEEAVQDGVRSENRIAGYIGMYVSMDEGEITNVAVHPSCRRKGIGRALLAAMRREAEKAGVVRMVLEVRVSNEPAVNLYREAGFVTAGIRRGFYEKPKEDAAIMVWEK